MRLTIRQCLRANIGLLLALLLLLVGCGAQTTTANDPASVHQAWINAISKGNKTQGAALVSFADATPDAYTLNAIAMVAPWTFDQVLRPKGSATEATAVSIWHQGERVRCFETGMRQIDGQVRVVGFGLVTDADCTTARQEAP